MFQTIKVCGVDVVRMFWLPKFLDAGVKVIAGAALAVPIPVRVATF